MLKSVFYTRKISLQKQIIERQQMLTDKRDSSASSALFSEKVLLILRICANLTIM